MKHFYQGGVGLRQFCDLSRFLWTFRGKIDTELLNKRLKEMGIISYKENASFWNAERAIRQLLDDMGVGK